MTQQRLASYSETGGATKTTTAVSLAVAAAEADEDVVLIDLDPRGATTKWTGAEPVEKGLHVGAILGNEDPTGWAEDLAVPLDPKAGWPERLRVVPSARSVANREKTPDDHSDVRLKLALEGLRADLVVLDCPNRQGGMITQNALAAANSIVYAGKPDEDGLDGVDGAKETVAKFKAHRRALGTKDELHELGIILGCAYKGAVWTRDALRAVREFEKTSPGMLFTPYIQDLVIVKESRAAGEFYGKYETGKPVADAYRALYKKVRITA